MAINTYKRPDREAEKEVKAKNRPKNSAPEQKPKREFKWPRFRFQIPLFKDRRFQLFIGFFFLLASLYLCVAFISYLFTGSADQSVVEAVQATGVKESGLEAENWLGLLGALVSHLFIFDWFGIGAFAFLPILFFTGYRIVFRSVPFALGNVVQMSLFSALWLSLAFGYLVFRTGTVASLSYLSGGIGFEMAVLAESLIGWGTVMVLAFLLLSFIIVFFNITSVSSLKSGLQAAETSALQPNLPQQGANVPAFVAAVKSEEQETPPFAPDIAESDDEEELEEEEQELTLSINPPEPAPKAAPEPPAGLELQIDEPEEELPFEINEPVNEEESGDQLFDELAEELDLVVAEQLDLNETTSDKATTENYDPTLDLARYLYPTLELLNEYGVPKIQVSKEELEANKDRIVETLSHYNIAIASIKATIGPTVTLYEIVPEAGVRISKIKSLEDDIALSLAALGIRIIAPIPGKGTIGIEVPNKQKEMVAMRSVISTEKFMKSDMELPIAFGKTIQNEVFVADLAKMPHLLMAGATGQGKSVGLNVILTSLLYKRHPSQLKFVLVDPKKVELSLFNKIERHFLAKLPDSEEAIITDTKKVVNTLNSLCMEMDQRYDLLKDAGCRNLKEYNKKFVERRLNPKKGHKFMPYIVLVIDELADLMMTAGKEVETPIARLAQLARAIGIHLIVATQRPSVNVITGIIKANFPARISFKVTSKIDSRTILDQGGADQLIGQGDMLFSIGSDLIRVQCAFVDTPEVDRIVDFIGDQQGYDSAYLLPEFAGDDAGGSERKEFDPKDRDVLFEEAARIIVTHQQGSTSLLQRRLNLGYNRAGRLIDQLEGAGVVGPFEGSKAREVLIPDEYSLEQLLNSIAK